MEFNHHSLIEELIMAPKIDTNWNSFPNEFFPIDWSLNNPLNQTPDFHLSFTNPALLDLISPAEHKLPYPLDKLQSYLDVLTLPEFNSFYEPLIRRHEECPSNIQNREFEFLDDIGMMKGCEEEMGSYKVKSIDNMEIASYGSGNIKSKSKKVEGQPSKNLMAERRRRKRLNDRLSMLRSIVPKISKMDRTSILGDTIDYMKELLDKINKLQEEGKNENMDHIALTGNYLKKLIPNEMLVRNPPKFDVQRRNQDTKVEVCCITKPGLLLATLETLDALGLDIQQCVVSCFNDFSLQASCYEISEHQSLLNTEDVKQALFRNAGYGGRCL